MADSPPFFAAQCINSTNAKAYRVLAGQTLAPIEGDVGSGNIETGSLQYNNRPMDRVVKFGDDVFMWQRDEIWKLNLDTGAWVEEFTVSGQNPDAHTGLVHIDINGVPSLIGFYGSNIGWITYDEVNGWVNQGEITAGSHVYGDSEVGVFRGICFKTHGGNSQKTWWYDPSHDVFTIDANPTAIGEFQAFANLGGRLYALGYRTNPLNESWLRYWTGSGWGSVALIGNETYAEPIKIKGIEGQYFKGELIAWDGSLYCFFPGALVADTYMGWWFFKYTPSSSGALLVQADEVDLTDPVIPSNYRAGSSNRSINYTNVVAVVDYDTDPASPAINWFVARNIVAEGWVYWRWNGEASPMTVVGTVGSFGLALSKMASGGGERFWTEGALNCQIASRNTGFGGVQYTFTAFGDPLILTHDTPAGGTGFEVGETLQGVTSSATGTIVRVNATAGTLEVGGVAGIFEESETVTQTTGGGSGTNADVTAAPTGGLPVYAVRHWYGLYEEPPFTQGVLTGWVAGGTAYKDGSTIKNVIADGVTEYSFVWSFSDAGIQPGGRFADKLDILAQGA